MRVGAQFQTHGTTAGALVDAAAGLVERGVDSVWVWDHLVPFTLGPPNVAWDAWTMLGAIGRSLAGRQVRLGVLVSPLSFREPAILARSAATVASLTGTTVVLGIGMGGFGPDDRLVDGASARRSEFVQRARRLRGEVDSVNRVQGTDVRLWVAGDGPRVTIPTAVELADGWNGFGPPAHFRRQVDLVNRLLAERARERDGFLTSVLVTRHHADVPMREWMDSKADELIVSLAPDGDNGFDTGLLFGILDALSTS